MKKLFASLTLAAAMVAPVLAHAGTLSGSFGIVFDGVSTTTTNPNGAVFPGTGVQSFSFTGVEFSNNSGKPQFPVNVTGTITGSMSVQPNSANGGTPAFNLTFANYGLFTATGNPVAFSGNSTPGIPPFFPASSSFTFILPGVFTTGTDLSAYTGGPSSLLINFENNGGAYSGSGTFSIAATPTVTNTPEPSSLALLGTGLLSAVGVARRRFKA